MWQGGELSGCRPHCPPKAAGQACAGPVSSPPSSAWARGGRWHCALASHLCPAREGLCVHFAFAEKAHGGAHGSPRATEAGSAPWKRAGDARDPRVTSNGDIARCTSGTC